MLSTLDCQVTMIIVIVGADDLARLIINFFTQIHKYRYKYTNTKSESDTNLEFSQLWAMMTLHRERFPKINCQVTMIIVIVGADDLARLIINFFTQIHKYRYKYTNTKSESDTNLEFSQLWAMMTLHRERFPKINCQVTMIIVIVGADDVARLIINFFIQI